MFCTQQPHSKLCSMLNRFVVTAKAWGRCWRLSDKWLIRNFKVPFRSETTDLLDAVYYVLPKLALIIRKWKVANALQFLNGDWGSQGMFTIPITLGRTVWVQKSWVSSYTVSWFLQAMTIKCFLHYKRGGVLHADRKYLCPASRW